MTDEQLFTHLAERDDARQKATLAGDIDGVAQLLGATLRYVHGSATDEDRALYLERLRSGYYTYKGLVPTRREFRRFGETVLVHGDMQIHVISDGAEKNFSSRYLQVWARENGEWKMVAWQSTPIPAA